MWRIILLFMLLAVALWPSCNEDDPSRPCSAYISGSVYFPDSTTAESATVRVVQNNETTQTNEQGRYSLDLADSDTCTVVAFYEGYEYSYKLIHPHQRDCSSVDFYLSEYPYCTPRSELEYPIGVYFSEPAFMERIYEATLGDSLWIKSYENYIGSYSTERMTFDDISYVVNIYSSLGDWEFKDYDQYTSGVPEILGHGYVIDTKESYVPYPNNGILEVEPLDGSVIVYYWSPWQELYVCNSIELITP
jgi:hypothetical protein